MVKISSVCGNSKINGVLAASLNKGEGTGNHNFQELLSA
jgi:hypothetical protein